MKTIEELYLENEKIVYFSLGKYFPDWAFDEDAQQTAKMALWKACRDYDEKRGKFSTCAIRYIRNEMWNYLRAGRRRLPTVSLDDPINDTGESVLADIIPGDDDIVCDSLYLIDSRLSERRQKIVDCLAAGMTLQETADTIGISRTAVYNNIERIRQILSEKD